MSFPFEFGLFYPEWPGNARDGSMFPAM